MGNTRKHNLIFIATVLYYAGSYIAETIPGGQLILVFAIGLMSFTIFSTTGGKIPVKNSGFIVYTLVFLLFCVASRLWAEDPSLSVNKINGLIFILIGMIIIHLSYLGYTSVEELLKAIMYGGYLVIIYAFFRYRLGGIIRLAANDARIAKAKADKEAKEAAEKKAKEEAEAAEKARFDQKQADITANIHPDAKDIMRAEDAWKRTFNKTGRLQDLYYQMQRQLDKITDIEKAKRRIVAFYQEALKHSDVDSYDYWIKRFKEKMDRDIDL